LPTSPPSLTTLFPYTTLFRSSPIGSLEKRRCGSSSAWHSIMRRRVRHAALAVTVRHLPLRVNPCLQECAAMLRQNQTLTGARYRSEEHTSELQSPDHLVCRLL